MPRQHYLPTRHTPFGYAFAYQKKQYEDMPTVEVDLFAPGMRESLIEAVCLALETWDPVFDHWSDPTIARFDQKGEEIDARMVPVFRGRHSDKVLKFRNDIFRYISLNPTEQDKNVFVKIASKYVHIRPTPRAEGQSPLPHQDITHYVRDVIRPVIRRSDPEWDRDLVLEARRASYSGEVLQGSFHVSRMLKRYDANHGSAFQLSYDAEFDLLEEDRAPVWEYWRLVAHYVQDISDSRYSKIDSGLPPAKAKISSRSKRLV